MNQRLQVFKNFTADLAKLSKCTERKVAAIITDKDLTQVHSIGINGGAKKLAQCLCTMPGKYGCLHAEDNCIAKNKVDDNDMIMFITLAPCSQCAARIINAPGSFSTVYYFEEWKEDVGIRMLRAAGIQAIQI